MRLSHNGSPVCGIDLVDNARHGITGTLQAGGITLQADEVVSLARDIEKKCTALSDDLVHGRSFLVLGTVLYDARRWQEALCYLDQARTVFKAMGNTVYLAYAYQFISWVHYAEHSLPDALDAVEEAWKYAKLSNSRVCESKISLDFGRILFSTNRDAEAWRYIEIEQMLHILEIGSMLHVLWSTWAMAGVPPKRRLPKCIWCL